MQGCVEVSPHVADRSTWCLISRRRSERAHTRRRPERLTSWAYGTGDDVAESRAAIATAAVGAT